MSSPPMTTGRAAAVLLAAGTLLLGAVLAAGLSTSGSSVPAAAPSPTSPQDALTASIEDAQERLEEVPGDFDTWATLGAAYVEQARVTGDASYYPRADGALQRSLDLRPEGNDSALSGLGALANARHDFAAAADLADRALAVNPASATAHGVRADALHQLGRYEEASAAVQRMLDLRPGVASFTRAAYDLELHGRVDDARSALDRALAQTTAPADIAFIQLSLARLAFDSGDLAGAERQLATGLDAVPDDAALLVLQAGVEAAAGDTEAALARLAGVVQARPLPEYLAQYASRLEHAGRTEDARAQYAVLDATETLLAANGSTDDLAASVVAAERGNGAAALALAETAWGKAQSVDAADALAWALHLVGRDAEALELAVRATSLGTRDAEAAYHRGMIELALGRTHEARASLALALDTNPYFSPRHAPLAQAALEQAGGR